MGAAVRGSEGAAIDGGATTVATAPRSVAIEGSDGGGISGDATSQCCSSGSTAGVRGRCEFFFKKRLPILYGVARIFYLMMLLKSIKKISVHFHKADALESVDSRFGNIN